jgi:hypothetical protein
MSKLKTIVSNVLVAFFKNFLPGFGGESEPDSLTPAKAIDRRRFRLLPGTELRRSGGSLTGSRVQYALAQTQ